MGRFSANKDFAQRVSMHRDAEQHKKRGDNLSVRKKQILKKQKDNTDITDEKIVQVPTLSDAEVLVKLEELSAKFKASNGKEEEEALRTFAEQHNLHLRVEPAVSKTDKSAVSRMVFNGGVEKPLGGYSPRFEDIANFPFKYAETPQKAEDYNLEDSSIWQVMKEYPQLAELEDKIKNALAKAGVSKELLPEMNINDFKYLLFNHCGVKKGLGFTKLFQAKDKEGNPIFTIDKNGKSYPVTTSAKQENVKRFMRENPQFKDMLLRMPNADRDYVDYLCKKMSLFGLTDMSKELERHPEWTNQPALDVHHIINVKDCRLMEEQGKSYTAVNDYENMCIVSNGTLLDAFNRTNKTQNENKTLSVHGGIHSADITFKDQKDDGEIKRTMVRLEPKPATRCMLGFHDDMIIKDPDYQQAQEHLNTDNRQLIYSAKQNEAMRA